MRLFLVLLSILALVACEKQKDPAEELYLSAKKHNEARQFDEAIKILQGIRINYESSPYAKKAEEEITRIKGLQDLVMQNQSRKIQSLFGSINTSLENYRARYLSYPLTTKDLEKLPRIAVPNWTDEYGREIAYAPSYSGPTVPKHLPDGYALASFGKDGLPGGTGSNMDYFFKNGKSVEFVTTSE